MPIVIPRREIWTRQPRQDVGIDWSNSLTDGLHAAVIGNAYDAVSGKKLYSVGATNTATAYGIANTISVVASNRIELPFEVSGAVSVHTVVSRDASVAPTGAQYIAALVSNRTAGQATFWEFNAGNAYGAVGDYDKPRFSSNSGGIGTLYLNGSALSGNNPAATALANGTFYGITAVAASGANSSGSGKLWLLGQNAAFAINGRMPLCCIWDRALRVAEVAAINANPWQIFQP